MTHNSKELLKYSAVPVFNCVNHTVHHINMTDKGIKLNRQLHWGRAR